ncbi:acid phosphatase [Caulobacter sp. X]|uniref:acid phosphatase n=1 Tax=Caulobacter sp. X TaxID=2048901 RepID=UPI000C162746|nr:acid phosphatase [Caulobacter sp. X]PIB95677.1 acid phosphatase [Caulobacter sp. X]
MKKPAGDRPDDEQRGPEELAPSRRGVLGALALAGAGAAAPAVEARPRARPRAEVDRRLAETIDTVVVIYAENRSFNNLFAAFPGLERPLADEPPERLRQRDRDGRPLERLPPIWGGMVPHEQVVEHTRYKIGEGDLPSLPNAPFALATPSGDPLPHGVITRDLVHAFYQNQMQINGGANDRFVAWGDSGALVMGRYGDAAVNLRLWRLAERFTLCDNFFMGAFGGSFLNHQYLIAAQPPVYPNADQSPAKGLIATLEGDDPKGARLKPLADSPASALDGRPRFGPSALTPDFWAVNTMMPPYAPSVSRSPADPGLADPDQPLTLPPQTHQTIGDRLSAKGVEWAWYAGAWGLALAGARDEEALFPARPNFQVHHQPFNYFANRAPGADGRSRLRDAGFGDSARTNRFMADAQAGRLPAVSFYKPQGDLNMHAGYSDVDAGDRHIARVVDALMSGPQWAKMLVVVTFDENGGWWDHVAPPKGDRWGPGTRVPALVISPHARKGHVDHTIHDTGSIQRLINRRFGLEPLPGIVERDRAMVAAGGVAPGDLTTALDLG